MAGFLPHVTVAPRFRSLQDLYGHWLHPVRNTVQLLEIAWLATGTAWLTSVSSCVRVNFTAWGTPAPCARPAARRRRLNLTLVLRQNEELVLLARIVVAVGWFVMMFQCCCLVRGGGPIPRAQSC